MSVGANRAVDFGALRPLAGDGVARAGTVEALLAPFSALERVLPRRLDDLELLAFAGTSRGGLYRAIETGALVPERAPVPGSRCFLTLVAVAAWRAQRTGDRGSICKRTKTPADQAGVKGDHERRDFTT